MGASCWELWTLTLSTFSFTWFVTFGLSRPLMILWVCSFAFQFFGWVRTSILAWMPGPGDAGGKKLLLPDPSRGVGRGSPLLVTPIGERLEGLILSKVLPIVVLGRV